MIINNPLPEKKKKKTYTTTTKKHYLKVKVVQKSSVSMLDHKT